MVNCSNSCIKVLTFIFSNIGLTLIVTLYVIFGGLIFQAIESGIEKEQNEKYSDVVASTDILVEEIWNMTKSNLIFDEKTFVSNLKAKVFRHKTSYLSALMTGYQPYDNIEEFWTLSGSILYSTTLVTTIGYGHFTCRTTAGKLITIIYSIIGIPMMGFYMSKMGESEANLCRFIYARLCCGCWSYKRKKKVLKKRAASRNSMSNISKSYSNNSLSQTSAKSVSNQQNEINVEKVKHEEETVSESDSIDYSKVRVPVSLTIFILTSYVMAGGVLFKIVEGWTLLDAVYFSFITVSTIGLGDLVPGNAIINSASVSDWNVVGVFCYLLIGLSLIVMGFNLLQETIVSWVSEFAAQLGILDADDESSVKNLQFIVSSME